MIAAAIQAWEEDMAATHVYAGTARSMGATMGGVFRQAAGEARWEHLTNGFPDEADVWSVCVNPKNPRIVYAGASPPGVYRSDDGGNTWLKTADPGLPDR